MKFSLAAMTVALLGSVSATPNAEREHHQHRSVLRAKDRLLEKIHQEREMKAAQEGMDGEADRPQRQVIDADEFAAFLEANNEVVEGRQTQEDPDNYNYGYG